MRALSIRQPYAELILRGVKTAEYRTRPTRVIGERFYLYAPLKDAPPDVSKIWSRDLAMPDGKPPPPWMAQLAEQLLLIDPDVLLPRGVIVGSAVIERVTRADESFYRWHLTGAQRATRLRKPRRQPQPVWFLPF